MQPQFQGVGPVQLPGKAVLGQDVLVVMALDELDAAAINRVEHQRIIAFASLHAGGQTPRPREQRRDL